MDSRPVPQVFSPHPPAYTPPSQRRVATGADARDEKDSHEAGESSSIRFGDRTREDLYAAAAAGASEHGAQQSPIPPPVSSGYGAKQGGSSEAVQKQYQKMIAAYGFAQSGGVGASPYAATGYSPSMLSETPRGPDQEKEGQDSSLRPTSGHSREPSGADGKGDDKRGRRSRDRSSSRGHRSRGDRREDGRRSRSRSRRRGGRSRSRARSHSRKDSSRGATGSPSGSGDRTPARSSGGGGRHSSGGGSRAPLSPAAPLPSSLRAAPVCSNGFMDPLRLQDLPEVRAAADAIARAAQEDTESGLHGPQGRAVLHGYLHKRGRGGTSSKRRWFVLRPSSAQYFKSRSSETPQGGFSLGEVQALLVPTTEVETVRSCAMEGTSPIGEDSGGGPLPGVAQGITGAAGALEPRSFALLTPSRAFVLQAPSQRARQEWLRALAAVQLYLRRRAGVVPWRLDSIEDNRAEGTQADLSEIPDLAATPPPREPRPAPPPLDSPGGPLSPASSPSGPRGSPSGPRGSLPAPAAADAAAPAPALSPAPALAEEGLGALESLAYGGGTEPSRSIGRSGQGAQEAADAAGAAGLPSGVAVAGSAPTARPAGSKGKAGDVSAAAAPGDQPAKAAGNPGPSSKQGSRIGTPSRPRDRGRLEPGSAELQERALDVIRSVDLALQEDPELRKRIDERREQAREQKAAEGGAKGQKGRTAEGGTRLPQRTRPDGAKGSAPKRHGDSGNSKRQAGAPAGRGPVRAAHGSDAGNDVPEFRPAGASASFEAAVGGAPPGSSSQASAPALTPAPSGRQRRGSGSASVHSMPATGGRPRAGSGASRGSGRRPAGGSVRKARGKGKGGGPTEYDPLVHSLGASDSVLRQEKSKATQAKGPGPGPGPANQAQGGRGRRGSRGSRASVGSRGSGRVPSSAGSQHAIASSGASAAGRPLPFQPLTSTRAAADDLDLAATRRKPPVPRQQHRGGRNRRNSIGASSPRAESKPRSRPPGRGGAAALDAAAARRGRRGSYAGGTASGASSVSGADSGAVAPQPVVETRLPAAPEGPDRLQHAVSWLRAVAGAPADPEAADPPRLAQELRSGLLLCAVARAAAPRSQALEVARAHVEQRPRTRAAALRNLEVGLRAAWRGDVDKMAIPSAGVVFAAQEPEAGGKLVTALHEAWCARRARRKGLVALRWLSSVVRKFGREAIPGTGRQASGGVGAGGRQSQAGAGGRSDGVLPALQRGLWRRAMDGVDFVCVAAYYGGVQGSDASSSSAEGGAARGKGAGGSSRAVLPLDASRCEWMTPTQPSRRRNLEAAWATLRSLGAREIVPPGALAGGREDDDVALSVIVEAYRACRKLKPRLPVWGSAKGSRADAEAEVESNGDSDGPVRVRLLRGQEGGTGGAKAREIVVGLELSDGAYIPDDELDLEDGDGLEDGSGGGGAHLVGSGEDQPRSGGSSEYGGTEAGSRSRVGSVIASSVGAGLEAGPAEWLDAGMWDGLSQWAPDDASESGGAEEATDGGMKDLERGAGADEATSGTLQGPALAGRSNGSVDEDAGVKTDGGSAGGGIADGGMRRAVGVEGAAGVGSAAPDAAPPAQSRTAEQDEPIDSKTDAGKVSSDSGAPAEGITEPERATGPASHTASDPASASQPSSKADVAKEVRLQFQRAIAALERDGRDVTDSGVRQTAMAWAARQAQRVLAGQAMSALDAQAAKQAALDSKDEQSAEQDGEGIEGAPAPVPADSPPVSADPAPPQGARPPPAQLMSPHPPREQARGPVQATQTEVNQELAPAAATQATPSASSDAPTTAEALSGAGGPSPQALDRSGGESAVPEQEPEAAGPAVPVLPDGLWGPAEETARMEAEEGRVWYGKLQAAMLKGDLRFRLPRDAVFRTAWRGEGKYGPSEEEDDDEDEDFGSDSDEEGQEKLGEELAGGESGSADEGRGKGQSIGRLSQAAGSAPSTPASQKLAPVSAAPSPADAAASGVDLFRRFSPTGSSGRLRPMIPRTPEEERVAMEASRHRIVPSAAVPRRKAPAAATSGDAKGSLCRLREAPEAKQVLAWLDRGGDPGAGRPLGATAGGSEEDDRSVPNRLVWADADTARAELRRGFGAIEAVRMIRRLREEGELPPAAVELLGGVAEGAVLLPHLVSASAAGGSISEMAESRSGKGRLGYASSRKSRPVLGMPGSGPAASMSAILARVRGRSSGVVPLESRPSSWESVGSSPGWSGGSGGRGDKLPGASCQLNVSLDHRWLGESRYCGGSPRVTLLAPARTSSALLTVEERLAEDAANEAFENFAAAAVRAWQGRAAVGR